MITLKFKNIETLFIVEPGNIYEVVLENPSILYNLGKMVSALDEDNIIIYDGKQLDNKKNILPIFDLFNMNSNDKKTLIATYKNIDQYLLKDEKSIETLEKINSYILNYLQYVSETLNSSIDFNNSITSVDLMTIYNFKYQYETENFLSTFISFLKSQMLLNKYKVIITFNLVGLLNNNDLNLLEKELSYLSLTLINIESKKSRLNLKRIIIDNDLCEF